MNKKILTIATRESQLALWQANWVKGCIEKEHPELTVKLLGMTTSADRLPYISLQEIGGKGLFVKELEEALLDGRADIAVHSMKDMPVDLPSGLCLPAMSQREDPWDVLVSNTYRSLNAIPAGASVGTSSLRRQSQLLHLRPDLQVKPLRGNVMTRLSRLDSEEYAAIILAAAGLKRLGLIHRASAILQSEEFLPAAGQGVLGLECREEDKATQAIVRSLNDMGSYTCVSAERAVCRRLGANCHVPVAAFAEIKQNKIILRGLVGSVDGKVILQSRLEGILSDPEILGNQVGDALLMQGAEKILQGLL
jgi:hydroxymethylbilane synthase